MLSGETVGEPIDRAHRERKCDHVMLSAPPTEVFHWERDSSPLDPVRAKHLWGDCSLGRPEMLRAHFVGRTASVLAVGLLGGRRAQHDMVTFSLSMGLLHAFANSLFTQHDMSASSLQISLVNMFANGICTQDDISSPRFRTSSPDEG